MVTGPSSRSVCVFPSSSEVAESGLSLPQLDLVSTSYIYNDPVSKRGHIA